MLHKKHMKRFTVNTVNRFVFSCLAHCSLNIDVYWTLFNNYRRTFYTPTSYAEGSSLLVSGDTPLPSQSPPGESMVLF